ncbi:MAG: helix-turn-helix domain-containing protein [Robiginitomaculum sp.]|nr:helix-turn-helix domain-containing protein [Robiginitomaculum sp.]
MSNSVDYHYRACGLDNVMIMSLPVESDDAGEIVIRIPNIKGLHRVLAHCLIVQPNALKGKELRFLRTEIGMTQAQLADVIRKDPQSIGRWERAEHPIDQTAEVLIRQLVSEKLGLETSLTIEDLSKFSIQSSTSQRIEIDGSGPAQYRPVAA